MTRRITSIVILAITLIFTIVTMYLGWELQLDYKALEEKLSSLQKLEEPIYSESSLQQAIGTLKKEIEEVRSHFSIDNTNGPLQLTEEVLRLLKQNTLHIIDYRLEEQGENSELVISAEGRIGNILKLFYELSYNEKPFRIIFFTIDAKRSDSLVSLFLRVAYA